MKILLILTIYLSAHWCHIQDGETFEGETFVFCCYSWKFSPRNLGCAIHKSFPCENLISTNSWQFTPTKVSHYTVPLNWVYISVLPGHQQTWGGRSWGLLRERGWRWGGHRSGNLGRSLEGWRVVAQCTCGGACSWQSPVLLAPPEKWVMEKIRSREGRVEEENRRTRRGNEEEGRRKEGVGGKEKKSRRQTEGSCSILMIMLNTIYLLPW